MNVKQEDFSQSQQAALRYYRLTDKAYLALSTTKSAHMNLGIWPAANIQEAQSNLVRLCLKELQEQSPNPEIIIEGGSGWGGARRHVAEFFPDTQYLGVNCSETQNSYASELNRSFAGSQFHTGFLEDIESLPLPQGSKSFFAVEAVIHLGDKPSFFRALARAGVDTVVLAEICLEQKERVLRNPLFDPSLRFTIPSDAYPPALETAGFKVLKNLDLTESVFTGWSNSLRLVAAEEFEANRRILSQFQSSYSALAECASDSEVSYRLFVAKKYS